MNVTTALAWSCYFFALTHLEPAIVNTVHSGMGPLTVVALAAYGASLAKSGAMRRGELSSLAGIALSIAARGGLCSPDVPACRAQTVRPTLSVSAC
jgi:hypothetical protein